MDRQSFELLLNKVGPSIQRQDTTIRLSIAPEVRLAVTLRYLATGVTPNFQHFAIIQ